MAFVERVADYVCWPGYEGADVDFTRREDAWATAWDRNELGLRDDAERRATEMLDVMRVSEVER